MHGGKGKKLLPSSRPSFSRWLSSDFKRSKYLHILFPILIFWTQSILLLCTDLIILDSTHLGCAIIHLEWMEDDYLAEPKMKDMSRYFK